MSKLSKFIKSTGIYFVGNVLTKVISFFLLPLYTNFISTDGMGFFDLANSYLNIIVPVVCIAIWSGILRFIFDFDDEMNKYKVIVNAIFVFLGAAVIYTLGVIILGLTVNIRLLTLIYVLGLMVMLQNCYSYATRGLGHNAIFALSGILGSLFNCVTNIVLILVFHMNESSLFISMALGLFVQIVVMECKVKLIKHFSLKLIDKNMIITLIRYSAPLAINSACYWFLSGYNRIGVSNILGLEANGIYAVAGKYTYVLGLVSSCFSMAMQEFLYSMGNDKANKNRTYTLTANYYIKFLFYGLLLLMPLTYFSFPLLIGKEYQAAFGLIPLYLLATVCSFFGLFLGDVFSAEKQTGYVFLSTIPAAVVNVAVFHLLVGRLGIQAANIALLSGFVVLIINRLLLLRKSYHIKLNYKTVLIGVSLFIVSFWVYMTQGFLVNAIATVLYIAITVFAFRDLLKQMIRTVKSKLGRR